AENILTGHIHRRSALYFQSPSTVRTWFDQEVVSLTSWYTAYRSWTMLDRGVKVAACVCPTVRSVSLFPEGSSQLDGSSSLPLNCKAVAASCFSSASNCRHHFSRGSCTKRAVITEGPHITAGTLSLSGMGAACSCIGRDSSMRSPFFHGPR